MNSPARRADSLLPENIQEHLENPFDQVGEDDISFNVENFIERLLHKTGDDKNA